MFLIKLVVSLVVVLIIVVPSSNPNPNTNPDAANPFPKVENSPFDLQPNLSMLRPDRQEFVKLAWKKFIQQKLASKLRGETASDDIINVPKSVTASLRKNFTDTFGYPPSSKSFFSEFLKNSTTPEESYAEHAQSFYPSCNLSSSASIELSKLSQNAMPLFFDLKPKPPLTSSTMIHVANLRLTKVPLSSANDNKEFRVSVFMLLKNETSKKAKKRLNDSKMIVMDNAELYIDFNIKKATRNWLKNNNYGLSVEVEDEDGNSVNALSVFKPIKCDNDPDKDIKQGELVITFNSSFSMTETFLILLNGACLISVCFLFLILLKKVRCGHESFGNFSFWNILSPRACNRGFKNRSILTTKSGLNDYPAKVIARFSVCAAPKFVL